MTQSVGCGSYGVNTLRPRQNGRHFADDTFKRIFMNENVKILTKISLTFVPKGLINNIQALVQIMAWRRPGDKPLSEPMLVSLPTHICVTRPQWVKSSTLIRQTTHCLWNGPLPWNLRHRLPRNMRNLWSYVFYKGVQMTMKSEQFEQCWTQCNPQEFPVKIDVSSEESICPYERHRYNVATSLIYMGLFCLYFILCRDNLFSVILVFVLTMFIIGHLPYRIVVCDSILNVCILCFAVYNACALQSCLVWDPFCKVS